MIVEILNIEGKPAGKLEVESGLWDKPTNVRVLADAVAMYRTNRRAGRASTKRRGEVSGGGKKPWRQKHIGRARAGSIRSPIWRHGGSSFGPKPRELFYRMPQQARCRALLESLKGKLREQELLIIEDLEVKEPKTKPFSALSKAFGITRRGMIVVDGPSDALKRSVRNLSRFELRSAKNLNALDVLNVQKVLVTRSALGVLEGRFKES